MLFEGFEATTAAACTSTGSATTNLQSSINTYLSQCKAGGDYPNSVKNFFRDSFNITNQFEGMKAMYDDLDITFKNIISNGNVLSFVDNLDKTLKEISNVESDLKKKRTTLEQESDAHDRRFVEEKVVAGDLTEPDYSSKMLQDKVIKALYITYLFFAIAIIASYVRYSGYSIKNIGVASFLILMISSILFALLKYLL